MRQSDVMRRAYELFELRGRSHGADLDDWLLAERELVGPGGPVSPAVDEYWFLAQAAGVNRLLIGTPAVTEPFLDLFRRRALAPIAEWRPSDGPWRPPAADTNILIVRELEAMTSDEQRRLFDWLSEAADRTQVVSAASVPLWPLVESGVFLDRLYYRLNIVCVSLT
jgi:hypothetical protein